MRAAREQDLVELVDPQGRALGESTVEDAHQAPGRLHRAFSVLLVDPEGRLLLQQRAAAKTRFPLRWANACCGHPAPGEPVVVAASRRLAEEVGLRAVPLVQIGVYVYRAPDPQTGRVEHEYDHVLLGRVTRDPALDLDPAEVAGVAWMSPTTLRDDLHARPESYAPWLPGVAGRLPGWVRTAGCLASHLAFGARGLAGGWARPRAGGVSLVGPVPRIRVCLPGLRRAPVGATPPDRRVR